MREKSSPRRKASAPTPGPKPAQPRAVGSLLTDDDIYLFNEGTHHKLYDKLGCRLTTQEGVKGAHFAVWAPNAERVTVFGDFNGWDKGSHRLHPRGSSGIWEGFIEGVERGSHYKFHISPRGGGRSVDKADPFALYAEKPPRTASIAWDLDYEWNDEKWMQERKNRNALHTPMSIYEMHLGSWRRVVEEGARERSLTYLEMAEKLADYVERMGFTHVQLLPIMEHPFYGSWGYQTTGYFAPTSRYGPPQDFMTLIDRLHQRGIGVILDWVPSHFPTDEHGLGWFDGTHLFEHADPRQGFHPDWKSYIFNYSRNEVRGFLLSSAMFWIEKYHIDAIRVDAVASMLYLDYSRKEGEWIPNEFGGRENLGAISFLRRLNEDIYKNHPGVQTIAEESTAWPMVSRPTYVGGLGFGFKWDMGWMHDTLLYMSRDPIHRRHHHGELTFRSVYAFSENFVMPLSHDEVVHGKGSLLGRMPGDEWRRFANLRLLLSYMYTQPGKKLIFMGGEFGQSREWRHDHSLDWDLLDHPPHAGVQRMVEELNRIYRDEPGLHKLDCDPRGFEWIDCSDADNSVLAWIRKSDREGDEVAIVVNFTPVPRLNYRVGAPRDGVWREIFNSDSERYGGSGQGNHGGVEASPIACHGRKHSLCLTLPPLAAVILKRGAPA
ncbi:MAG: 1,4-alpha-glucan branching protein GlgB [Phycisphaeraceae bacterium]|nr:MAG: 1,4-alpha-glucan branching protein GlgB [Phycisphaeraceae bacterium]